ncbi:NADPH-dependent 7-cyano-7-deazaguanine reductase QueF [Candidatus Regiella insecticola]|uniref:NADPH-dependent 7-cyano-7-deazaguanine reductase n=1 Tax=Candidatus Regiella insecticola TaxID=138073 RepID=A0A6L2ZT07_9ENTR|nr:NADPH-dependent 7-cyano-7-deazaguanine reductase QueF [Candidatus Regiella insecticola]GFN47288.1 NADPH-dependent 7-cyano-7-deazaguanine reductase [Candidatus Regiella insecticola]
MKKISCNYSKHLGKKSYYIDKYTPSLLESIPRSLGREQIGLIDEKILPNGFDLWTAFELSWLNKKGKPIVAIAEFKIPATSKNLIESKSFKLYLNSLNQSHFDSSNQLQSILSKDLSNKASGIVSVEIFEGMRGYSKKIHDLDGISIDEIDIEVNNYDFNDSYLKEAITESSPLVAETLTSNLLKSNCLVTNQPDWGSIYIKYEGKKINREKLLRYIISFRKHNEFHEQCVERIFSDIKKHCSPKKLSVFARYTRRGGLDINPFRSDYESTPQIGRLIRQ